MTPRHPICRKTFSTALALLALALSGGAHPQEQTEGPEKVLVEMIEVMRAGEWEAYALYLHPDALAEFRSFVLALAKADETGELEQVLLRSSEGELIEQLDGVAVFERFMQAMAEIEPGAFGSLGTASVQVLGSVVEDDLVHVVYRMQLAVEGTPFVKVAVQGFKRDGNTWKALLTGDIQALVASLQEMLP